MEQAIALVADAKGAEKKNGKKVKILKPLARGTRLVKTTRNYMMGGP